MDPRSINGRLLPVLAWGCLNIGNALIGHGSRGRSEHPVHEPLEPLVLQACRLGTYVRTTMAGDPRLHGPAMPRVADGLGIATIGVVAPEKQPLMVKTGLVQNRMVSASNRVYGIASRH